MAGIYAIYDIEARYQHFRETLTESAQQVLPEVERTARQKWMTAPILLKMEQRRLAKGNVALYNLLASEIRQDYSMYENSKGNNANRTMHSNRTT